MHLFEKAYMSNYSTLLSAEGLLPCFRHSTLQKYTRYPYVFHLEFSTAQLSGIPHFQLHVPLSLAAKMSLTFGTLNLQYPPSYYLPSDLQRGVISVHINDNFSIVSFSHNF